MREYGQDKQKTVCFFTPPEPRKGVNEGIKMPWHVLKQKKRRDRTSTPGVKLRGQYSRTQTNQENEKPSNTTFAIRHSIPIHSPSAVTGDISFTYSLCNLFVPARVARHSSKRSNHEDNPAVWRKTPHQNKGIRQKKTPPIP